MSLTNGLAPWIYVSYYLFNNKYIEMSARAYYNCYEEKHIINTTDIGLNTLSVRKGIAGIPGAVFNEMERKKNK